MSHNRPPVPVIIVVVLAILGAAAYFLWPNIASAAATGTLTASGTVESTSISIAPEISGKVAEVMVKEGDSVKAGDVLFRLDDTLLKAQKDVATAGLDTAKAAAATSQAAVASAQTQYDIAFSAAAVQDRSKRTTDWYGNQPGEFTLPLWYYTQAEQLTAAQTEVDAAQSAWTEAQKQQANVEVKAASADFVKAETDLAAAQARYQVANNMHERVKNGKNIDDFTKRQMFLLMKDAQLIAKGVDPKWVSSHLNQDLRDAVETIFDDAKTALDDAQEAYDDAVTTDGAKDVMEVRAQSSVAEERYYTALDYVRILQTGPEAQTVNVAKNALEQAKSAAAQAQTAVSQSEANLALIDAQLAKLLVTAPEDGVIMTRNVEPGEVVNPGSVVLSLSRLSDLTITVYIPEDRYGEVALGQDAKVTVDSFTGQTFSAKVVHISDQAEFTPRNVQTVEGRKSTVFAVKLQVNDPDGKLKPGMPADVTFK
jgi:multidrug resistance efflux pump